MPAFAWPSGVAYPTNVEWRLPNNAIRLESPYSRIQQVHARLGARWECTITWPMLRDAEARRLIGALLYVQEDGANPAATEWRVPYFGYTGRLGSASGAITATGSAGSHECTLANVPTSASPQFVGGDAFVVGEHAYLIQGQNIDAPGGTVVVRVWPPLRVTITNAPIALTNITIRMRQVSPIVWRAMPGGLLELDPIDFVEAVP